VPPMALKSIGYGYLFNCHGRGCGFEPHRPRHTFQKTYGLHGPYHPRYGKTREAVSCRVFIEVAALCRSG
jgi:hypothetical protein